jgi:hypothetical protein
MVRALERVDQRNQQVLAIWGQATPHGSLHSDSAQLRLMNIKLRWHKPLLLRACADRYECDDLHTVPAVPGIYVFGRKRGDVLEPLYIGLAKSLRLRTAQHFHNVRLMEGLRTARAGRRLLMIGELISKHPGNTGQVLRSIERAMIRHALEEGWEILNKHGTARKAYVLHHTGSRAARAWLPRQIEADQLPAHTGAVSQLPAKRRD